jgi:hypothetical protein
MHTLNVLSIVVIHFLLNLFELKKIFNHQKSRLTVDDIVSTFFDEKRQVDSERERDKGIFSERIWEI